MRDFLVEIHTEELPPKSLVRLASSFLQQIENELTQATLTYESATFYATPRRLAVFVKKLQEKQKDTVIERKGPALSAAYDAEGNATPACVGFAKSCGVTPDKLITIKNAQGEWVSYKQSVTGKKVNDLLPGMVEKALAALPIAKRMRWGEGSTEFVRPVHSVILLYGNKVIPTTILGCKTDRKTRGHRFLSKSWVSIASPTTYLETLKNQFVMADFEERKNSIREQTETLIQQTFGKGPQALIENDLLDEVTGLVEWPVAISGTFDENFLQVPQEVLISAMQDHQRYFPVIDANKKLLPYFVTMCNIKSKKIANVIEGNERVLRARLSDAAFFFETDKKLKLTERLPQLKNMVFQNKLGTLYDKSERLANLSCLIAESMGLDAVNIQKIALLAKTDLTTQLVGEFPELQGVAGFHYALAEGIPENIASVLYEQYLPRFSGDQLPKTSMGAIIAIADRIDTLVGVFGIHQAPTGDKDPFGLRRAALGVLRILIEKEMNLDLSELLKFAAEGYTTPLENKNVIQDVMQFMLDRLKPWYQEQHISADVLAAVTALNITKPYDLHRRIQAVESFKKLPEAEALSIANKRVSNILAKYEENIVAHGIDTDLFEVDAEKALADALQTLQDRILTLSESGKYTEILTNLASLREPVDLYFEKVLVMTEDKATRENRLLLLKNLRELFLHVADIALLQ